MKSKKYVSIYDQIRNGKVTVAKMLFLELGISFEKCANSFTEEELAKTFDFFNKRAVKGDDDAADIGMWIDFLEESANFLSKKSHELL